MAAIAAAIAAYFAYEQTQILQDSQKIYVEQIRLENEISGCRTLFSNLYDLSETDRFQIEMEQRTRETKLKGMGGSKKSLSEKVMDENLSFEDSLMDSDSSSFDFFINSYSKRDVSSFRRHLEIVSFSLDRETRLIVGRISTLIANRPPIFKEDRSNMAQYLDWKSDVDDLIASAKESCLRLMSSEGQ